jgi:hypothetical protein
MKIARATPSANTAQPWPAADDFYELLLDAHQGLTMEESTALNARLVLLLAQRVGELPALRECLHQAQQAQSR